MTKTFSKDYIKNVLKTIWFSFAEWKDGLLYKKYGNYKIEVDISKEKLADCKINYWDKIQINRETTSNLSQAETLVVLECVDRLLEKWYKPESIELEKDWKLGHKGKGFLDVWVKDPNWKSFLMIECKTWGDEYEKEYKKTKADWWQLFSYYIQEPDTKYLCLYASTLENNQIKTKYWIILIEEDFKNKNQKEIFEIWNGQIKDNWIFENLTKPYIIKFEAVKKLIPLEQKDWWIIFNKFAEILRQNVVSDKTNAFNKMFNLFLCKIVDEDEKREDEEKGFQRKDWERAEDVLIRLNDLYKRWTKKYLNMNITDYSEDEIEDVLNKSDKMSQTIKDMFIHLRLYKNSEFAFKEVFDEKSFIENAKIVKAVVKLLENYKLKYTHKNQFLWTFFEKLLNTGIKQEAGQFFTPIPIARFICNSIPFEDIIKEKIDQKEPNFLPYVMDYASGSWHFLTEAMDRIDKLLHDPKIVDINSLITPQKNKYTSYSESYQRAKEFVYWIEKDYRLTKTTKVNCFLNGDWEATVICGDGLDNFQTSQEYLWILKRDKQVEDNQVFDCVVANPPYSVSGFKNTLSNAKDQFKLYDRLTDNSSEIECLFVERTKQLLKDWGIAGLILPVSILNNGGIYSDTRELILKYFDIKSIVELGSNTFMATGTNTIVLFMKRRNNFVWENIQKIVDDFFVNYNDVVCNGIENVFSKYANYVYGLGLKDYIDFVQWKFDNLKEKDFLKDYKKYFDNQNITKKLQTKKDFKDLWEQAKQGFLNKELSRVIIEKEKEKLLYFALTYSQKIVVVKSPSDVNKERDFLWYKFSDAKWREWIKIFEDENQKIKTKLYSEYEIEDKTKTNTYILNIFRWKELVIDENMKDNLTIKNLVDLMDFWKVEFDKSLNSSKKEEIKSKWQLIKVEDTIENNIENSDIKIKKEDMKKEWNICVVSQEIDLINWYIDDVKPIQNIPLVVFWDHTCIFKYIDFPFVRWADWTKLLKPQNNLFIPKIFYYLLKNLEIENSDKYMRHWSILKDKKIPLPPIEIQEKILKEMDGIERIENEKKDKLNHNNKEIETIIEKVDCKKEVLGSVCDVRDGTHDSPIFYGDGYPLVTQKNITSWKLDLTNVQFISESDYNQINKRSLVEKWDVLFAMIWTIWNPVIVDVEPNFAIKNVALFKFQNNNKLLNKYFKYLMDSEIIKNQLEEGTKGSTQKFVWLGILRWLKIPLPPIEEQKKIVDEIEKLEKEKEKLQSEIGKLEGQKKAVLDKYL